MELKEYINQTLTVTVDRKMGSKHPKHGFIYPVNYGYIEGIRSPDGEELDAYILGVHEPVESFTGKVIAIIERENDNDPKLIVVPDGKEYSDDAIYALVEFQEKYFKSHILR